MLQGAVGAAVGGVAGMAGAAIEGAYQLKYQERQIEHDKNMAALNQQNLLAQMEKQNQYQVEQWNRENEYNDPSAVSERYRAAGINPRAAFGSGSASGAGISGGLSSAPSGSSTGSASNIMGRVPNWSGALSNLVSDAMSIESAIAEKKRVDSENELRAAQAKKTKFETDVLLPIEQELKSADLSLKQIDEYWKPLQYSAEIALTNKNVLLASQQINESVARQNKLVADSNLSNEQKKLVTNQIELVKEQVKKTIEETIYTKGQTVLAQSQVDLNKLQEPQIKALTRKICAEVGLTRVQSLHVYEQYLDKFFKNDTFRRTGVHSEYFDPGNYLSMIAHAITDATTKNAWSTPLKNPAFIKGGDGKYYYLHDSNIK